MFLFGQEKIASFFWGQNSMQFRDFVLQIVSGIHHFRGNFGLIGFSLGNSEAQSKEKSLLMG